MKKQLLSVLAMLVLCAQSAYAQTGVSDDRVSLPDGPGSLEGVGENVEVDPNMGLMSHKFPLRVPKGFPGMTPSVGLTYSSGGGGSVAGMGWTFQFPQIERLTKRGLPEYDVDDEFMASEGGELVRIPDTDPPVYRSRFEKGFIRFTWYDANESSGTEGYWTAEYPDGRIGYFGADKDGALVDNARVGGSSGTFRYHLVDLVDRYGHRMRHNYALYGNVTLPQQVGWVYVDGAATRELTFAYESRSDKLSDCKPGFDELLEYRLKTIYVRVKGTTIRRYALSYEDYATSGGFSRLAEVKTYGRDGGLFGIVHSFGYSQALGGNCTDASECSKPYVASIDGALGVDLKAGRTTLIDLTGDGLPDFLDTSSTSAAHRIWINHLAEDGTQSLSEAQDSAVGTSTGHQLGTAFVQVLDVDGDGFTDMLNAKTGEVLRNYGDGDWDPVVDSLWDEDQGGDMSTTLGSDFDASEGELSTVRFMDYDGDKLIDVIRSLGADTANVTTIYRNVGVGTFMQDPDVEPVGAGFDSDTLELNDMNGDGLLDPVQVMQSEVRYRLNMGWGKWGDWQVITGFDFTQQEAIDAELEDMNGDGLADIVLVASDTVTYWVNRNGASFDEAVTLTDADVDGVSMPVKTAETTVLFADMNGNGSSDVVWVDNNGQVTFLELFPERPNLLTRVENGIGSVQQITYGSSVAHQAADGGVGAWAHRLPHAMNVVNQVDIWDELNQQHDVTKYTYHDGFYDGVERDFRGYARVETFAPGDETIEEGEAVMVFDVGADDTYRNGLLLSVESRSAGTTISIATTEYDDCEVADVPDSGLAFDIRHICAVSTTTELQEGLDDSAEYVTTKTSFEYDGYGNCTFEAKLGVTAGCGTCTESGYTGTPCGDECLGDEQYTRTEYAVPADNDDRWILRSPVRTRSFGVADAEGEPAGDLYTEQISYYDGTEFEGLPFGKVTHGSEIRLTERVNTAGDIIESQRRKVDEHGNVIETIRATGSLEETEDRRRRWSMDDAGLNIVRSEILLSGSDGPYVLRRDYVWSEHWDEISEATEWHVVVDGVAGETVTALIATYDEFGMVASLVYPGASVEEPSQEYSYELASPTSRVVSLRRSELGGPLDLESVACLDGRGRTFQEKKRVSDGVWQVTRYATFNPRGEEVRTYESWTTDNGDCDTTPAAGTPYTAVRYDGTHRLIEQILPQTAGEEEAPVRRTVYLPLAQVEYDSEDTYLDGPHYDTPTTKRSNGIGAVLSIEELLTAGADPYVYGRRYDELGNLSAAIDPVGVERLMAYDLLGRMIEVDDPDRGLTTYEYDAEGHIVRRAAADGTVTLTSWDGAGRMLAKWQEGDEDATRTEWHWDFADDCPEDTCTNTAGRQAGVEHPLGGGVWMSDQSGFDARGRLTWAQREIDGRVFEVATTYDHAGRAIRDVYPNGFELERTFDGLDRVASVTGYVDSVTYDESGTLAEVVFANGVVGTVTRDERGQVTAMDAFGPGGEGVLDLAYQFDRAGHVVEITDGRDDDGHPLGGAIFTYDSLYRVTAAELDPDRPDHTEVITVEFDAINRIVSKVSDLGSDSKAHVGDYTYGGGSAGPHALTQAGSLAMEYDAAGRVVQRGDASYTWDYLGRLTDVSDGSGGSATFGYDSSGQRVLKREDGHVSFFVAPTFEVRDGVAVTSIELSGDRAVRVDDATFAAQVLSDVAPASGSDDALEVQPDGAISAGDAWISQAVSTSVMTLADGGDVSPVEELLNAVTARALRGDIERVEFDHHDHRGNTVAVTDDQGSLVGRTEYYPYGQVRYTSSGESDRGFTGKERDASTGLVYIGQRHLDSWTGRWTAPDPAFGMLEEDKLGDYAQALSPYGYGTGDPVNGRDDDGQFFLPPASVVGAAIGLAVGVGVSLYTSALKAQVCDDYKFFSWSTLRGAVARGVVGAVFGGLTGGASAIGDVAGAMGATLGAGAVTRAKFNRAMMQKHAERAINVCDVMGSLGTGLVSGALAGVAAAQAGKSVTRQLKAWAKTGAGWIWGAADTVYTATSEENRSLAEDTPKLLKQGSVRGGKMAVAGAKATGTMFNNEVVPRARSFSRGVTRSLSGLNQVPIPGVPFAGGGSGPSTRNE